MFISYRRSDTQYVTTAIHERLAAELGAENLFLDVHGIRAGLDFREELTAALEQCQVVLIVIGEHWLDAREDDGSRRIEREGDFVGIEIQEALAHSQRPVIPVLVADTPMPSETQLPESIRDLAFRQAVRIRPAPDFSRDVDILVTEIRRASGQSEEPDQPTTKDDTADEREEFSHSIREHMDSLHRQSSASPMNNSTSSVSCAA